MNQEITGRRVFTEEAEGIVTRTRLICVVLGRNGLYGGPSPPLPQTGMEISPSDAR